MTAILKYIVLGDAHTGKTCLISKYVYDRIDFDYNITIGIEFAIKTVTVNDITVKLHILDTAGQEQFRSITRSYYNNIQGVLLCYDTTNRTTFENIKYWIDDIRKYCKNAVKIILVGNKIDLENKRLVSTEEGEQLAAQNNLLFIETSVKKDNNVTECFDKLTAAMNPIVTQPQTHTHKTKLTITIKNQEKKTHRTFLECCNIL